MQIEPRALRIGIGEEKMASWTHDDQQCALADGWGIFENSDHGHRIERHDDAGRFDCDAAAQAYVAIRALERDQLAKKAWEELAWHHAVMDAARGD